MVRLIKFPRLLLGILVLGAARAQESTQEECTMGADGTCLEETTAKQVDDGSEVIDTGYGEPQRIAGAQSKDVYDRIDQIKTYMQDRVFGDTSEANRILQSVAAECKLRHEHCAFWATIGECEANPAYMTLQCAPACYTCESLAFETRCPMPTALNNTWAPGGLNQMFDRIASNGSTFMEPHLMINPEQKPYDVNIILQPKKSSANDIVAWEEEQPWVITIDNFLTDTECETLIELGGKRGYEQSMDVGAKKFDGTYDSNLSPGRTSTNAWCQEECLAHPVTQTVIAKIENLTAIPDANAEYLQLLRYEEGQFYQQHHDYIEFHTERAQGVRILTVFLYLNDVEEGGGTNFPLLNVTVMPKRGRALLWPSVHDQDPDAKDGRTDHQAMPVTKGIKFGANAWLHQRDFKAPFAVNCI